MKREKPEVIISVLWPLGSWEQRKGRWEGDGEQNILYIKQK